MTQKLSGKGREIAQEKVEEIKQRIENAKRKGKDEQPIHEVLASNRAFNRIFNQLNGITWDLYLSWEATPAERRVAIREKFRTRSERWSPETIKSEKNVQFTSFLNAVAIESGLLFECLNDGVELLRTCPRLATLTPKQREAAVEKTLKQERFKKKVLRNGEFKEKHPCDHIVLKYTAALLATMCAFMVVIIAALVVAFYTAGAVLQAAVKVSVYAFIYMIISLFYLLEAAIEDWQRSGCDSKKNKEGRRYRRKKLATVMQNIHRPAFR